MQNLINIEQKQIGTQFVQSVYARDLHAFLENKDMFAHWIKDRISQFGFVENQDFVSFWENPQKPQGGRPSEEYHLTLDMAKELSMVERTPKGKEARQYFIECERRLFSNAPIALDETNAAIKQYLLFLRANKASGLPLTIAVEQSRQAMRDNGINIDKILPMPTVAFSDSVKINAEKDAAARDRIFSIIQSKGSVPQGVIFNRCRNMRKEDVQKHIDVLLLQNKIQQIVLENPTNKKRFNLYRMAVTFN
jgi:phage anti-repressor protein